MRIAILDDDATDLQRITQVLDGLARQYDEETWTFHTFSLGEELLKQLKRETFDLLILDWQLPDISGIALLDWAHRHLDPPPPVIMVTSRNSEEDTVQALMAGADDYVNKPFRPFEFQARVRTVLRRYSWGKGLVENEQKVFGSIVFNDTEQKIIHDGKIVHLTEREYSLARCLFNNLNRPLSREYLYERFWPHEEAFSSRPLDTHIYRLRSKLALTPEHGWRLATIYGYGYRLEQVEPREVNGL